MLESLAHYGLGVPVVAKSVSAVSDVGREIEASLTYQGFGIDGHPISPSPEEVSSMKVLMEHDVRGVSRSHRCHELERIVEQSPLEGRFPALVSGAEMLRPATGCVDQTPKQPRRRGPFTVSSERHSSH